MKRPSFLVVLVYLFLFFTTARSGINALASTPQWAVIAHWILCGILFALLLIIVSFNSDRRDGESLRVYEERERSFMRKKLTMWAGVVWSFVLMYALHLYYGD